MMLRTGFYRSEQLEILALDSVGLSYHFAQNTCKARHAVRPRSVHTHAAAAHFGSNVCFFCVFVVELLIVVGTCIDIAIIFIIFVYLYIRL
jgi:hypothetical protein